jgi:pyridoxamine 5'-phosphate oxidase
MHTELPPYYNDLEQTLEESWRLLGLGAINRKHGFHHASIATIGLDGAPRARTVILRQASKEQRSIIFHTDQRSTKMRELEANPRIAVHFYDGVEKAQIRIEGVAKLHVGDDFARKRWDNSQKISRMCYSIQPAPGENIDAGGDYLIADAKNISISQQDVDFQNFAAVEIVVFKLEWLFLAIQGHRRARFMWDAQGNLTQNWLVP